jgi:hypothetical protein
MFVSLKACELMIVLKDELEMNMRLIGARTIEELDESMVDTRALATHIGNIHSCSWLTCSPRSKR